MKQFKFTINGTVYNVTVNKVENAVAEVEVNGTPYKVCMDKPAQKTVTIKRPAQTVTAVPNTPPVVAASCPSGSVSGNAVKSPLSGVILSIDCKVGDEVKKGQQLLILEAMKMENSIPADHDGKIIEIKVKTGDSVREGVDLIIIKA